MDPDPAPPDAQPFAPSGETEHSALDPAWDDGTIPDAPEPSGAESRNFPPPPAPDGEAEPSARETGPDDAPGQKEE